jgi:hypothetical protein
MSLDPAIPKHAKEAIQSRIAQIDNHMSLPDSAPGQNRAVTLDFRMASELLEMFGGEPGEVSLLQGEGHSGEGLYAYWTELPNEGCVFLGNPDDEAAP